MARISEKKQKQDKLHKKKTPKWPKKWYEYVTKMSQTQQINGANIVQKTSSKV